MALTRLSPRASAPISLALAKSHCRVDHSEDDTLITLYIQAAVDHVEGNRGRLGRALLNQAWELTYDAFPCGPLLIPLGPLVSVTSVEYVDDVTGILTTWANTNYTVDVASYEGWIAPVQDVDWPVTRETLNAVKVTFVAGHGATEADCPADLKMALLQLVSHWYENREAVSDVSAMSVPLTFESLIDNARKIVI